MLLRGFVWRWLIIVCIPAFGGCSSLQLASASDERFSSTPIRFLLTFDDGPSGATKRNPTSQILHVLAHNQIQSNVKAVFFVQTRAAGGGGTQIGQKLLRRTHTAGHLLAFHTATKRHSNHRFLAPENFESSLKIGVQDLFNITGINPKLVRPPFWSYDSDTLSRYQQHGLQMLLTDLSANDGVIYGVNWSWRKKSNLLNQLRRVKSQLTDGGFPVVDGNIPIVVAFHDINRYTARKMEIYMQILIQVATELNLELAEKPFYDERLQLEKAALARSVSRAGEQQYIPGLWGWLWSGK